MQTTYSLPPAAGLGEDFSSLRKLFARSFPFQDGDGIASEEVIAEIEAHHSSASVDEFDWSVTLDNIRELTGTSREAEARVRAAEERAERAEARAKVAEHWLRRLHQAVLEGMPQHASSGEKGGMKA
ncbi:hypothetical protein [Methylobacterium iners]|uniref:hypothetical protein n=1 Tax=Methylobacterium iners TaxID=418707 RepID=UPI001EE1741F|nr:hypothetical protein [Methylobacterium iners]